MKKFLFILFLFNYSCDSLDKNINSCLKKNENEINNLTFKVYDLKQKNEHLTRNNAYLNCDLHGVLNDKI